MSHWFEYFPGHHMWSQGMMFGIEMAVNGAAALGDGFRQAAQDFRIDHLYISRGSFSTASFSTHCPSASSR